MSALPPGSCSSQTAGAGAIVASSNEGLCAVVLPISEIGNGPWVGRGRPSRGSFVSSGAPAMVCTEPCVIVTSPFVPRGLGGFHWGRCGEAEWARPGKELGVSGYQRTIGEGLSLAPVVSLTCLGAQS